jgi:hypothetical protein
MLAATRANAQEELAIVGLIGAALAGMAGLVGWLFGTLAGIGNFGLGLWQAGIHLFY